jgi:hypothetical protein
LTLYMAEWRQCHLKSYLSKNIKNSTFYIRAKMVPLYYYISLSLRAGVLASLSNPTRKGSRYEESVQRSW